MLCTVAAFSDVSFSCLFVPLSCCSLNTDRKIVLAGKIKEEDIHRVVQRMLRGRASVAALGNLRNLPPLEDIETGLLSKEGTLPSRRFSIFGQ